MSIKSTVSVKESRRKDAELRQAEYDKLSTKEKLEALDRKFGAGLGAKKVRAKLSGTPKTEASAVVEDKK